MNCIVWNFRGTGAKSFPGLIRDLKRRFHVDFLALVETRQEGFSAQRIMDKFGFDNREIVEAVGFSGGIWCLWRNVGSRIRVVQKHNQFIHFHILENRRSWFLTVVYGSPHYAQRRELWSNLKDIGMSMVDPWCIIGDFNAFLFHHEKFGGSANGSRPDRHFLDMVDANSLVDLGFFGLGFTWKRNGVAARLDSALANTRWRSLFPEASVMHLPPLKSDHSPILVRTHDGDWHWSLTTFQDKIKVWNRAVVGNIFRKKERLLKRLQGIHEKLSSGPNLFLSNLQEDLWMEYDNGLTQEEILWMQKSREQWIVNGDRNTRYFHISTMIIQEIMIFWVTSLPSMTEISLPAQD
ncbi:RNA-directed DNA polymerase [Senna tora]|uniref:RNA-directed DNA polymerase n=1 Tax=Senna tora TaxID=362788 RepID=A0A834WSX4_9FABA|nr:RNA-directed DNA polymerase [Senna tora]